MRSGVLFVIMLLATGCKSSDTSAPAPLGSDTTSIVATEAAVKRVTVDSRGYTPSSITAERGKPLALEFVRTTDDTCAKAVRFPELGVSQALPLNSPVRITVPTNASKTYSFACGMGMFAGELVIH